MAVKIFSRTAPLLLLLTSALPALAGGQYTVDTWRKSLKEIDQKLRAQQWEAAEKQSRRLADQVIEEAGLGDSAAYTLSVVSAFRAVAEAGQGREEDADWHWVTALSIFPDIGKTDLSPYGPPRPGSKSGNRSSAIYTHSPQSARNSSSSRRLLRRMFKRPGSSGRSRRVSLRGSG